MKKLSSIWMLMFWLADLPAFCQGAFTMQNYGAISGVDAPVFDADGVPLFGTDYLAILYAGPTPDSLELGFGNSVIRPYAVPFTYTPGSRHGYFGNNFYVSFPNVIPDQYAWLQVRVWDARLGNSFEEVAALGRGGYGASCLFYARAGGGGSPPAPAGPLIGLQSFSLVPEPGAWALLLGGLVPICCGFVRSRPR